MRSTSIGVDADFPKVIADDPLIVSTDSCASTRLLADDPLIVSADSCASTRLLADDPLIVSTDSCASTHLLADDPLIVSTDSCASTHLLAAPLVHVRSVPLARTLACTLSRAFSRALSFILSRTLSLVLAFPLTLLLTLGTPGSVRAQSTRDLSLQDCIELAVRSGPSARAASLRFAESGWNYRSYQASLRPILTLDGSAPGVERSIAEVTRDDGTVAYVEQNRVSSSFDLSLDQAIPLTGGSVSLGSGLSRTDEFGNIERTQWQTTPLAIRVDQPLFRFNSLGWERKTAPRRYDLARGNYLWDLEGVARDVADRFFRLYVANLELENAETNAAVNDTIYTLSRGRFDIGMIAENDLLQSELALINAQTELADLRIEYEEALRNLKIELGLSYGEQIAILPPLGTPEVDVDPGRAVQLARENRPDFLSMEIQDLEADGEIARAKSSNRLTADLSASYGLNQSAETLDAAYRDPLDRQRFNVGFRLPLLGWGRNRAAIEAATAAANRTSLENDRRRRELDQDVYFEATRFGLLEQQIRTAAKADTVATRRFEVARNRYLIGKIGITELFDAQQQKDSANTRYIETLRSYWVAFYRLRQLTLYDFVADRPIEATDAFDPESEGSGGTGDSTPGG